MRRLTEVERSNWNKYHIRGCSPIHRVKVNAISISPANTKAHEMKKCEIAYDLVKQGRLILTEAQENKSKLIRDVVNLSTGDIYEVETDSKRAERFKNQSNVVVVKLWKD